MEHKLCVDCKFHERKVYKRWFLVTVTEDLCKRTNTTNLVTGEVEFLKKNCEEERSNFPKPSIFGHCGYLGKYWEKKEEVNEDDE